MYYVSAQGVDERMINIHYYYYDYDCIMSDEDVEISSDAEWIRKEHNLCCL